MINIKKQDAVADAVKEILQQEALKGNQHKIDKNKNNKIDAHDFKILRGEKKVEEGNNPFDYKNYTSQIPKKPGETAGFDSKKISTGTVFSRKPVKDEPKGVKPKMEEVEQIEEAQTELKMKPNGGADVMHSSSSKPIASITPKMDKFGGKHRATFWGHTGGTDQTKEFDSHEAAHKWVRNRQAASTSGLRSLAKAVREEKVELDEREMTPVETSKKERIVKGMKKSLKGFKARYGERAKSVMYATATKQAMKEESIEEGKRPESDTVPFVTDSNTSSSPLKRVKEVAGAAMNKISKDLKTK